MSQSSHARYTPVSLLAVLKNPDAPGHLRIVAAWVGALALSIALGVALQHLGGPSAPFAVFGAEGTVNIRPPLLVFGVFALWFGASWGYWGALLGGAVVLAYSGTSPAWSLVVAALEALGVVAIATCYRVVPTNISLRTANAWLFYLLASLLGAVMGAAGPLAYSWGSPGALSSWQSGWVGPFVQWVVVAGPILWFATEVVDHWKRDHRLVEPWSLPDSRLIGGALVVGTVLLSAVMLGTYWMSMARLRDWAMTLQEAAGGGHAIPSISFAPLLSIALLVGVALAAYQTSLRWRQVHASSEQKLAASEARARALIDAIPDLVLRIRSDGTVLAQKDGLGLLGATDLTGKSITEVWPSRITSPLLGRAEDALVKGSAVIEFRMTGDSGLRDYEARIVATDEDAVVAIVRDVTRQRLASRAQNEFTSTISRELRTPLTSVRGALGLIRGGVAGEVSPKVAQLVDVAYRNTERMVRLAEEVLDVRSRDSSGLSYRISPVDLSQLLEAAVYENRMSARELGLSLIVQGSVPDARVQADPDRVLQVLNELLANALKFSPSYREVQVSLSAVPDGFRVQVKDEGHGIPEAFQGRVFRGSGGVQPDEERGLRVARNIVLHLGGRIGFESKMGRGSTFWFELPLQPEADEDPIGALGRVEVPA